MTPDAEIGKEQRRQPVTSIKALIVTYTIVGVPYYNYSIMAPKNPILIKY